MPDSPDVSALKRRGRRRLVGAIALAMLAVIVLPMVFDAEPRPPAPPVSVRIPGEDESGFSPKVTPRGEELPKPSARLAPPPEPANAAPPPPSTTAEKSMAVEAKPKPVDKSPAPPVEKPGAAESDKQRAESDKQRAESDKQRAESDRQRAESALAGPGFVIGLGAFADEKNVRALMSKLKSEKIPAFAEPLETAKGPRTRVRAGPFASEDAAEKARARLLRIGVQAGPVTPRTG